MVVQKEDIHKLIERLPEEDLKTVFDFTQDLLNRSIKKPDGWEEIDQVDSDDEHLNSLEKAKETLEKISKYDHNNNKCEYQQTINRVVSLLREEIDLLDRLIDELSDDSPVLLKFELHQSCFERLLGHAVEEQKKINEIWGGKK